jgi:hypothetical protein
MTLSPNEQRSLRILAGMMIPASTAYQVPGADDATIFADILASLGPDEGDVRSALHSLDTADGGAFASLDPAGQTAAAERLRSAGGAALLSLSRVILQCYYRDDRVMRSLDLEPRPPFPQGHTLEQGDWSLLDPVRARPKFYREAP